MVVLATYVTCTTSPANQSTTEGHAANRVSEQTKYANFMLCID